MITLKLIKGLSYTGWVNATKKNPYVTVEDEAIAEKAVASGYFEIVSSVPAQEPAEAAEAAEPEPAYGGKTLAEMTKSEIETFATYKNVSLKGITKKTAMIAALKKALPDEDLSGEIKYGSPTIVELQDN